MRTPVELRIPIPDAAKSGDRVQVYSDFRSGVPNMGEPLLADPVPIFPAGLGRVETFGKFSMKGDMKTRRPGARLSETVGLRPSFGKGLKTFRSYVQVTVFVPLAYGMFRFYPQLVDAAGNVQGGTLPYLQVFLSGNNPPPVRSFALAGYDGGTDQLTFSVSRNEE